MSDTATVFAEAVLVFFIWFGFYTAALEVKILHTTPKQASPVRLALGLTCALLVGAACIIGMVNA